LSRDACFPPAGDFCGYLKESHKLNLR
jgi:hypothetical protein